MQLDATVGASMIFAQVLYSVAWPPRILSPNSRVHWSSLAKAKRIYRHACGWATRDSLPQGGGAAHEHAVSVTLRFVAPDRRARDEDNIIAAMKAGIDGIADGIGLDDGKIKWSYEFPRETHPGGKVLVEVSIERRKQHE